METGNGAAIRCADLSRRYGEGEASVMAVDGVTLDFPHGQLTSIVGPSGSGKSTLLNLIGGLDQPSAGEILFDERSLAPLAKREMARYRREAVGMIFQNFNLIATMTAAENVELALAFGGRQRGRERARHARELLERVGLGERHAHRPAELSGGEQQRVAIARALANRPRVLLADEPTGNLDSTRAEELLTLLRGMAVGPDGLTVLLVTHDRDLAARFADRAITMKDGKIQMMNDA